MSDERRTDFRCVLFLAAVATLLFADVLFLGNNFYARDLFAYHFPMKHAVRELIARGEMPWWNPYVGGGQPMAANPAYEIFYPLQWLIFIGSFEFGFALHIVAHVYLALIGMYAMLRSIPLRPLAALFGALSFGLSGLLIGSITNLPTFFVWSWAPAVGLTIIRLLRAPDGRRFATAAIVAAMPLLVGEPMAVFQVWLMIAIATIAFAPRRLPLLGAVALASAAIAAVQVIPMIDHLRDSSRARGLAYELVVDWSMPLLRPIELLTRSTPPLFSWGTRGAPYLISIYAGVAVPFLAVVGFVKRLRGARIVAITCALSYLLAIGGATPLFRLLYVLGVRSIRYPEKFAAMGVVALIVFAAMAADSFSDIHLRRGAFILIPLILLDLGTLSVRVAPRMPRAFFTPPRIVAALDRDRDTYAVFHRGEWAQKDEAKKYRAVSPAFLAREGLQPYTPESWGLRSALEADFDETYLLPTHDLLDAMMRLGNAGAPNWSEPFITMSNVRYVIDYVPFGDKRGPIAIRKRNDQGRYVFASRVTSALLPDMRGAALVPWPAFAPASGGILDIHESANEATLDVESSGRALLVITITRHKYWQAAIDGQPAALLPANIAYQALVVPAGKHRVTLRYRNPLIGWGAAVSIIALLGAAGAGLEITAPIRRRRRLRSES